MKNHKREEIVADIRKLANNSYQIAESISDKFNEKNCPSLNELFVLKQNGHVFKQKNIIEKYKIPSKGLYVLGKIENNKIKPVYVGIAVDIIRRLKEHTWAKNNNQASLAYLIAMHSYSQNFSLTEPRFQVVSKTKRKYIKENDPDFLKAKEIVRNYYVVTYPIEDSYELHFHEIAIACILKTYWNSFRTN